MDSPIVTATWQAGALSALSNILAQFLSSWKAEKPFTLNITDLFQFILFSILSCPPNYIWQGWLEAQFPAYAQSLTENEKEALVDEVVAGSTKADEKNTNGSFDHKKMKESTMVDSKKPNKKLNIKNTLAKFTLDQTFGGVVNTLLFIAGIGLIRGQSTESILKDVELQFGPMMVAGVKLWPLVSILNFTLVPLQYRMLVGNIAGLVWGVYLSLMAGAEK